MRARYILNEIKDRVQSRFGSNRWQYRQPQEAISVAGLVSPLRYDILLRRDYFRFLRENLELFDTDFEAFLDRARQHSYFNWFRDVLCDRRYPHLLNDPDGMSRAFETRLRQSRQLYDRFQQHGFDKGYPLTVESGDVILPTTTGKHVSSRYFAGDGCHRLALVILSGADRIPPDHYRIKHYQECTPVDNTHRLLGSLKLSEDSYYAFVSMGYVNTTCSDRTAFLATVEDQVPERLAEARQIITIDGDQLSR